MFKKTVNYKYPQRKHTGKQNQFSGRTFLLLFLAVARRLTDKLTFNAKNV